MSSLTTSPELATDPRSAASVPKRGRRRRTSHLKLVPESRELRERIRQRVEQLTPALDKTHPLGKDDMERVARELLAELQLPEGYVGWTMVTLASAFWREQVAAVPFSRRLLLLPHCLKHAEGCPADYDEFGLDCRRCGACSIADFRTKAEELGYKVLVAEGSPIVLKIIVSGYVDAIVGVACLNVLEKAIDKILVAGIPCMAVPLLSSDCRNTSVDEEWVRDLIELDYKTPTVQTRSYLHLMRAAANLFQPAELERLAPRLRGGPRLSETNGDSVLGCDPVSATETIAYDFLTRGGKHSRPFITLAAFDALRGEKGTLPGGEEACREISDSVRCAALSIETFHKASLVHDDIEDDDSFRYGDETLHRRHGVPTAINVGDYLIGLGYRLVSRETSSLGSEVTADILNALAGAHMRLSEGQGAELLWRDSLDKRIKPLDALKIYALKTAPAFQAALYAGVRLAGPVDAYEETISQFSRHLGVAFQILNDLADWQEDDHNKLSAGGDILGGRPTILWALALESLSEEERTVLENLVAEAERDPTALAEVRRMYDRAGVFENARRLIDKYQQRAEEVADRVEPEPLRRLLYFLVDTVLDRSSIEQEEPALVEVAIPHVTA